MAALVYCGLVDDSTLVLSVGIRKVAGCLSTVEDGVDAALGDLSRKNQQRSYRHISQEVSCSPDGLTW